jgi:hypothetical protein
MPRLREEEWRVSRAAARGALAAPVVGGALVAVAAESGRLYRVLVREDALLEWCQVGAWLIALGASALLTRRTHGRERIAWIAFALGSLAAAGEELSWGQRLLDFDTPGAFRDADKQEEATLHNLDSLETATRVAVAAVAAAGAVGAWVTRRIPRFLVTAFAITALYELARLPAGDNADYRFAKYAEWPELCFAGGLAALAVCTVRRLQSGT